MEPPPHVHKRGRSRFSGQGVKGRGDQRTIQTKSEVSREKASGERIEGRKKERKTPKRVKEGLSALHLELSSPNWVGSRSARFKKRPKHSGQLVGEGTRYRKMTVRGWRRKKRIRSLIFQKSGERDIRIENSVRGGWCKRETALDVNLTTRRVLRVTAGSSYPKRGLERPLEQKG